MDGALQTGKGEPLYSEPSTANYCVGLPSLPASAMLDPGHDIPLGSGVASQFVGPGGEGLGAAEPEVRSGGGHTIIGWVGFRFSCAQSKRRRSA